MRHTHRSVHLIEHLYGQKLYFAMYIWAIVKSRSTKQLNEKKTKQKCDMNAGKVQNAQKVIFNI